MKKNFLFTAMAFVMGLIAASCSQDEIISSKDQTGGGTVSIAVNIPVNNPVTRVAQATTATLQTEDMYRKLQQEARR